MQRILKYIISENTTPVTILDFLKKEGFSRHILSSMKNIPNTIILNGERGFGRSVLKPQDHLIVTVPETESGENIIRTKMDLNIIYEDEDILIADKPYNMLSQKARENDVSANEYLLGYLIRTHSLQLEDFEAFRPSVCNRLDRNTTGLLLMGKSLKGLQTLSEGLRERTIHKYYRAIVAGEVHKSEHLIGYLTKNEKENMVTVTDKQTEDSSRIETAYEPVKVNAGKTLLEIHLITGKTHQIRAHLASIGHPIIGDMKYGDKKVNQENYEEHKVTHQLLHAYRMEFPDGRIFCAPVPDIFVKLGF